jgi:PadR family transcriptional regulator, regulatory protein PadR
VEGAVAGEQIEFVRGTVDVLILRTLRGGALHGYGVAEWLRERTGGRLQVQDAALYQALRRLEERGLVEAEWGLSENNRRARYYMLTAAGRRQLKRQTAAWRSYAEAVFRVLDPVPGEA